MKRRLSHALASLALTVTVALAQVRVEPSAFQQAGQLTPPFVDFSRPATQSGPVIGKPLSGKEVRRHVQILADGTQVETSETTLFYRDAMGRMRDERENEALIYDPVAGCFYHFWKPTKTAQKGLIPAGVPTQIATAASGNVIDHQAVQNGGVVPGRTDAQQPLKKDIAPQHVNGVPAKGSRITITIPAGTFGNNRDIKVINERWFSDELAILVKSTNSDPRFGITSYEMTDIERTAPDPALFQVPADYTVSVRDGKRK
jgi:hypothetical protein